MKDLEQRLSQSAVRRVDLDHVVARLAIEEGGGHGGGEVAVLRCADAYAASRGAGRKGSSPEGVGDNPDVSWGRVCCDEPLDEVAAAQVGEWDNAQQKIVFFGTLGGASDAQLSAGGAAGQAPASLVATLDVQNVRGDSALHIAAKRGQADAFEFLLAAGADAELRNDDGKIATEIMTPMKLQEALLCVLVVGGGGQKTTHR